MHEADLKVDAGGLRGGDDATAGGDAAGHRFLQQDRLAGGRCGNGDLFVVSVRRRDDDRIDVRAIERMAPVASRRTAAVARGKPPRLDGVTAGDQPDIGAAGGRKPREVVVGDEAGAEHRDADTVDGHVSLPFMTFSPILS